MPLTTVLVSVIVPTANRPHLLSRAIRSIGAQTMGCLEIVVVVDGTCRSTLDTLATFNDPRIRVLVNTKSLGAAESRNRGVSAAIGQWVAFLDDDDEWLPEKLERQLALASGMAAGIPVVAGRVCAHGPWGVAVWPSRLPKTSESVGHYLFRRRTPTQGEALISTITLLAPRQLFLEVPFNPTLTRHQEWDWLLRAEQRVGVQFLWVQDPVAVWHVAEGRKSISSRGDWRFSLQWMKEREHLLTSRARAGFLAAIVAGAARSESDVTAILAISRELWAVRCLDPAQWILALSLIFLPTWCRTLVRKLAMPRRIRDRAKISVPLSVDIAADDERKNVKRHANEISNTSSLL